MACGACLVLASALPGALRGGMRSLAAHIVPAALGLRAPPPASRTWAQRRCSRVPRGAGRRGELSRGGGSALLEAKAPQEQVQIYTALKNADDADEVLSVVRESLPNLSVAQSTACLAALASRHRTLSSEAAQSVELAELFALQGRLMRDIVDDAKVDHGRIMRKTAYNLQALHPIAPSLVEELLPVVTEVTRQTLKRMRATDICDLLNCRLLRDSDSAFLRSAAPVIRRKIRLFGPHLLSNVTKVYAEKGERDPDLLQAVAETTLQKIDLFTPEAMCTIVWGFATLGETHTRLMQAAAEYAARNIGLLQATDLSMLAWAYSTLRDKNMPLFRALAKAVAWKIDTFKPSALSTMVWSFAHMKVRNDAFMEVVASSVIKNINSFDAAHLSRTAWSFATLNVWNPYLMNALAARTVAEIHAFTPWGLSNTMWAFGTLNETNAEMVQAVATRTIDEIETFIPMDVSNIIWAFARLEEANPDLMRVVAGYAVKHINEFTPQGLSNIIWAFATLKFRDEGLIEALTLRVVENIDLFRPQGLSNIVWALATLNVRNDDLMQAVSNRAVGTIRLFVPQELGNLAWGFTRLGVMDKPLMESIAIAAIRKADELNSRDWMDVMLATAQVGMLSGDLVRSCSSRMLKDEGRPLKAWRTSHLKRFMQLLQALPEDDVSQEFLEALTAEVTRRGTFRQEEAPTSRQEEALLEEALAEAGEELRSGTALGSS